jgi:hypothetical protein
VPPEDVATVTPAVPPPRSAGALPRGGTATGTGALRPIRPGFVPCAARPTFELFSATSGGAFLGAREELTGFLIGL